MPSRSLFSKQTVNFLSGPSQCSATKIGMLSFINWLPSTFSDKKPYYDVLLIKLPISVQSNL